MPAASASLLVSRSHCALPVVRSPYRFCRRAHNTTPSAAMNALLVLLSVLCSALVASGKERNETTRLRVAPPWPPSTLGLSAPCPVTRLSGRGRVFFYIQYPLRFEPDARRACLSLPDGWWGSVRGWLSRAFLFLLSFEECPQQSAGGPLSSVQPP